jgi:hypothetical protein
VPVPDPLAALHRARRRYAEAIMRRRLVEPGQPGYHKAVHEVGVAWALVKRWERAAGPPPTTRGEALLMPGRRPSQGRPRELDMDP